jgi:acetyl esterase
MATDLIVTAQHLTLKGLLALPTPVKRALAGGPVVREGLTLDTETQLVLRLQRLLRERGPEEYDVPAGRRVLDGQARVVGGTDQPIGSIEDRSLGGVPGRIYVPEALMESSAPRPTLVFIHGGGFVYGGLESHDAVCRVLAERAGVQVIAVDYRLAPEHPFPVPYDDCLAAYVWIVEHAVELSVDRDRLAVGGDSAGGNLAAAVALEVTRTGLPLAFQLLVYPTTDMLATQPSRKTFGQGFYLNTEFMDLATASHLPVEADRTDPRAHLVGAEIPAGLAPAYVITAGFDPLRDEGEVYAKHLADAGVDVTLDRRDGMIHGFLNWVGVGSSARGVVLEIADRLGEALSSSS